MVGSWDVPESHVSLTVPGSEDQVVTSGDSGGCVIGQHEIGVVGEPHRLGSFVENEPLSPLFRCGVRPDSDSLHCSSPPFGSVEDSSVPGRSDLELLTCL